MTVQFQWAAHQEANRKFAEVVFAYYEPGDMVWVQDYHLMLLPALLKLRKPKMKVILFILPSLAPFGWLCCTDLPPNLLGEK